MGHRTKALIPRLRPGDIAFIDHADLDEVAADALRRARVRAVVNGAPSITGRYPNLGPSLLLAARVPLLDVPRRLLHGVRDGQFVRIDGAGVLYRDEKPIGKGRWLLAADVEGRLDEARTNLPAEVERFIDNTLKYAEKEKHVVLEPFPLPPIAATIADRPVVVVVRGHRYRDDLDALAPYIADVRPVLIGVDGGADALLEAGHRPDIIVGDMDSVSDRALRLAPDIIVHAYADGKAPGLVRMQRLGLPAHVVSAPGTSEDVAMLLAYEARARLIVAVGTHSHLIDFLEKGREGMASTFLVRLKVGSRLIDAKGVSYLYRAQPRLRHPLQVTMAALVPALVVVALGGPLRHLVQLMWIRMRVWVGW